MKTPNADSDENQNVGGDITPGRDMGTEAPDNGVRFAGFGETRIHVNPALFEQVPRIDTSVNAETDMQPDVDDMGNLAHGDPRKSNILQPKGRLSKIIRPGTVDPLTQQPEAGASSFSDTQFLQFMLQRMEATLQGIAILTKAQIPILPMRLQADGLNPGQAMVALTPYKIWGQVEGKNVAMLHVLIQNNSGGVIVVDFDKIATPGSISIQSAGATATGIYETQIACDTISIMSLTATPTFNSNSNTAGVVVRAWTNPEWRNMWGQ